LELSKLVSTVTDDMPSMIGSKNDMLSLLYKCMHKLRLQNELLQYYCIIHQHNITGKALEFKQIITDIISTVNYIRSHGINHRQFQGIP